MNRMTIGKLAAAEGVGVETVRFYQRRGLLGTPQPSGSGYREYSEADRSRLVFIRRARQLGFTLAEIADLLGPAAAELAEAGPAPDMSTKAIAAAAQAKLAAVDGQMRELMQLRCRLRQLVYVCEHGDGQQCAALATGVSKATSMTVASSVSTAAGVSAANGVTAGNKERAS